MFSVHVFVQAVLFLLLQCSDVYGSSVRGTDVKMFGTTEF